MAYIIRQVKESIGLSDDAVYTDGKIGPIHGTIGHNDYTTSHSNSRVGNYDDRITVC